MSMDEMSFLNLQLKDMQELKPRGITHGMKCLSTYLSSWNLEDF